MRTSRYFPTLTPPARSTVALPEAERMASWKFARARQFRRELTPAERRLWRALRVSHRWRVAWARQVPLRGFILDFYAPVARIAVEVDGPVHARQITQDQRRDRALASVGIRTVRVSNADVLTDLPAVITTIRAAMDDHAVSGCPYTSGAWKAHGRRRLVEPAPLAVPHLACYAPPASATPASCMWPTREKPDVPLVKPRAWLHATALPASCYSASRDLRYLPRRGLDLVGRDRFADRDARRLVCLRGLQR